jgi:molecular chaperone DnaK (HSP70)
MSDIQSAGWLSRGLSRHAVMRTLLPILTLSLLVFGCQKKSRAPLVVEDATPIVGTGRATTEALGIETLGGVFTSLIKPGTTVPCSLSEIFSTAADGQSQILVTPFRGTNQMAASNHALGRFQIVGIPTAPRGTPQVEVTFTITERQILISARDLTRKTDLEIQRASGDTKL